MLLSNTKYFLPRFAIALQYTTEIQFGFYEIFKKETAQIVIPVLF